MKALNLIAIFCFTTSVKLLAQTPQTIEADLLKSFKKIDYWDLQQSNGCDDANDSLVLANESFANKLKKYTAKCAFTINMHFNSLVKERVSIVTSADGLFRIYSWNTQLGGTMHVHKNLFQYKTSYGIRSDFSSYKEVDGESIYLKLYTVKTNYKTYYLGISMAVLWSGYTADFINAFAIENKKLNDKLKIIKTEGGLENGLSAQYDCTSLVNRNVKEVPYLSFNLKTQTIHLPLILTDGKITGKYVNYKFNGQYFEKIKS
ncbi:hypothetical protein ACEN9X_05870 [Mucilaginibacter sp. Mucisp86]|uniref:hypothetical protein n=1 Tax=Mucilaginibacter sp. Mucisp86 TaxID=3243060 RepID=UPI0039B4825C